MFYSPKKKLNNIPIPPLYHMDTAIYRTPSLYEGSDTTPQRHVEEYEIELYTQSSGAAIINGEEYPIKKGMMLFSSPGDIRNSRLPFICKFVHLPIPNSEKYKKFRDFLDTIPKIIPRVDYDKYSLIFDKLEFLYNSQTPYREVSIQACILELINEIFTDTVIKTEYYENENIRLIIKHMEENLTKNLTLDELSDILHFSPNYFHKYFKEKTGFTPHKYLLELRITKAKKLLDSTAKSLISIAEESGFESQAYFCYVFKKETGMTPKEYRKKRLEEFIL
ncbi:MAG: AraC family transcriptional regulator [Ruminococcaceae bacterium]|nr:AraC family transcriptional regulator [Oscillospiraceae bacterium]